MKFIVGQLQQLGMVAIIMVCALGGTVGILTLIKRFLPGREFPKDPIVQKMDEEQNKREE